MDYSSFPICTKIVELPNRGLKRCRAALKIEEWINLKGSTVDDIIWLDPNYANSNPYINLYASVDWPIDYTSVHQVHFLAITIVIVQWLRL